MPEYVYALHNFAPEHEDEIAFEAGQPIEVIEKDDQYNDGWWQVSTPPTALSFTRKHRACGCPACAWPGVCSPRCHVDPLLRSSPHPRCRRTMSPFILCLPFFRFKGRNIAGKIGLFPQSYTTPAAPLGGVSTSSSASSNPITTPPDSLSPLGQEHESTLQDDDTDSKIGIAIGEPDSADAEVMKATMSDVQEAIEQLGRNDRDGAQSFSFSSTRDGDTDRETDGTETDGEIGEAWHRSARDKLAEQARKVVEAQAAEEAREVREVHGRMSAPPIDVELSDESEAEEEDAAFQHLQHMHFTREHPHIPEEEEEEEARRNSVVGDHRRKNSNDTSSAIRPKDDLSSEEEESGDHTAPANQTSFAPISSPPRFTRSPIPNNRRSPRLPSASTTSDVFSIVAPIPIVPMGVHMIRATTSPEPPVRATRTPSITREIPAALPSPALTASGGRHHSRQASQPNSVSSTGKASAGALIQSAPESEAQKKSPPSEWTVDEVIEWLKSKGFGSDVCDKFIGQSNSWTIQLVLTSPSRRARNHGRCPPRARYQSSQGRDRYRDLWETRAHCKRYRRAPSTFHHPNRSPTSTRTVHCSLNLSIFCPFTERVDATLVEQPHVCDHGIDAQRSTLFHAGRSWQPREPQSRNVYKSTHSQARVESLECGRERERRRLG